MKLIGSLLFATMLLTGCTHGALKVAASIDGPWIVADNGAIFAYRNSAWEKEEPSGTADDIALCGAFLTILTKPDAQGVRSVKSRDIHGTDWTTYPPIGAPGAVGIKEVACDGYVPVVLAEPPSMGVFKFQADTQSWKSIHTGALAISIANGRLFHLYPTTTNGNVWSRDVDGGSYTRWGETMVASKIAGDANGYPWVAVDSPSNPLYKWDTQNNKWTFGFSSGSVFDMDIQSYVTMYILSEPQIGGQGYTVYSHELYSGGWTKYPLPSD